MQLSADSTGITWTPWGARIPGLEQQRTEIETCLREGWRTLGDGKPGPSLPPTQPSPFIDNVTDAEVIISGSGEQRRVAVLFSHQRFPGVRFGHRFPLDPFAEGREQIWLMEEIDTGALHRVMGNPPATDDAGIIWTTWGSPVQ